MAENPSSASFPLTHLCRVDFYLNSLDWPISIRSGVWLVLSVVYIYIKRKKKTVLNSKSVDPDQTPHYAASDLGVHCLPIPFYGTLGINGLNLKSRD